MWPMGLKGTDVNQANRHTHTGPHGTEKGVWVVSCAGSHGG